MLRREGYRRVKEAAELLGVSLSTVRAWGAEGKLQEYRHPVNNYRFYKRTDLEWINAKLMRAVTTSNTKKKRAK
jgi:DNA (cytosine-5)-methyltransferase 1